VGDLLVSIQTQEDLEMLDESKQNFKNYKDQSEKILNDAIALNF